jgi:hypothetical protein
MSVFRDTPELLLYNIDTGSNNRLYENLLFTSQIGLASSLTNYVQIFYDRQLGVDHLNWRNSRLKFDPILNVDNGGLKVDSIFTKKEKL